MAGIEVHPRQRRGAMMLIDDALRVAAGAGPPAKVDGYRDWLSTPSATLRHVLGLSGVDPEHWHRHRIPQLQAYWCGAAA